MLYLNWKLIKADYVACLKKHENTHTCKQTHTFYVSPLKRLGKIMNLVLVNFLSTQNAVSKIYCH